MKKRSIFWMFLGVVIVLYTLTKVFYFHPAATIFWFLLGGGFFLMGFKNKDE